MMPNSIKSVNDLVFLSWQGELPSCCWQPSGHCFDCVIQSLVAYLLILERDYGTYFTLHTKTAFRTCNMCRIHSQKFLCCINCELWIVSLWTESIRSSNIHQQQDTVSDSSVSLHVDM